MKTDFLRVNLLPRVFKVSEGGGGVSGKVLHGGVRIIAGGLSDSPFIEAKNGDAFSRQVESRQDDERDDARRAIRRGPAGPAALMRMASGKRPRARWKSESSCERRIFALAFRKVRFLLLYLAG